jgi:hypothetical protein
MLTRYGAQKFFDLIANGAIERKCSKFVSQVFEKVILPIRGN